MLTNEEEKYIFNLSNMYHTLFKLHTQLLKALANEKRLEIIHLLREQELTVSEIQTMLDLEQANLSQHLMILRKYNIVTTRKKGKEIYYQLSHNNIIKASDLLREILIERHKDDELANGFAQKMTDLLPLVHDPVCGMRISPKTAGYAIKENKKEYYFCASGCYEQFKKNAKQFINS